MTQCAPLKYNVSKPARMIDFFNPDTGFLEVPRHHANALLRFLCQLAPVREPAVRMNVAIRYRPLEPAEKPGASIRPVRIAVLREVALAGCYWQEIEAAGGIHSPYQNYDWVRLWDRHVSGPAGQRPCIVIGFDVQGAALFVWPLVQDRFGPLNIASFFGGKHATLNVALWRPDAARGFTAADMTYALAEFARQCPDLDCLMLSNQPETWHGLPNPFALLPHQQGTEDNFVLQLGLPGAQIIERELSSTMRSRLRNKERKLAKLADYRYVRAANDEEVNRLLDAFFAQKADKLTSLGIENVFAQPGVEDFVRAACRDGLAEGKPLIELHALDGGGEMLALFSGLHDGRRFTSAFNSHTASEHSRQSPGLILLQHLIMDCANRGFDSFDIGPGEARYKTFFCKDFEPIFDSILPLSTRGHLLAMPLRAFFRLKAAIKRNPAMWRVAYAVRAALNRVKGGTPQHPQQD
jgi:CelD/BcsL family acetyltransferase involved in cellulose biosynthesis